MFIKSLKFFLPFETGKGISQIELGPAGFYLPEKSCNLLKTSLKTAVNGFGKGIAYKPLFKNIA